MAKKKKAVDNEFAESKQVSKAQAAIIWIVLAVLAVLFLAPIFIVLINEGEEPYRHVVIALKK